MDFFQQIMFPSPFSTFANLTEVSKHTYYPSFKTQRPEFQIQDTYGPARIAYCPQVAFKQTTTWDRLIHVSPDKSTTRDNV